MRYIAPRGLWNAYAGPAALLRQLRELTPWTVSSALICLAPLAAGLLLAHMQAHRFAALAEIKAMMTAGMLPILRRMSWWVCPGSSGWMQRRVRSFLRRACDLNNRSVFAESQPAGNEFWHRRGTPISRLVTTVHQPSEHA